MSEPSGTPDQSTQPRAEAVVVSADAGSGEARQDRQNDVIEQPAKVMRIGSMVKQLLEEVRNAPLDDAGRARLAAVHERSLTELEQGLSPELVAELRRVSLPFSQDALPSDAELRIAQTQLVGWLEGLFHGIQATLVAQQMAAQQQIAQMRRALPAGPAGAPGHPGHPGQPGEQGQVGGPDHEGRHGTGQYL